MTDEQLKEIEQRVSAATPGPWGVQKSTDDVNDRFLMAAVISSDDVVGGGMYLRDATFIASAREDVPALVAEVGRLRTRLLTLDTAVSNKQFEIERLRAEIELNQPVLEAQAVQIERLQADIERLGRERDDMERACKQQAEELAQLRRMEDDLK